MQEYIQPKEAFSPSPVTSFTYEQVACDLPQEPNWEKLYKDLKHDLEMELLDPHGTIWEHAKKLQDEVATLRRSVANLADSEAEETRLKFEVKVLEQRLDGYDTLERHREENIQMHTRSNSMDHCKAAWVDYCLGYRRWLPVTEAHWDYWNEVLPVQIYKNQMLMCSELSVGKRASVVYRRPTKGGPDTYWFTMATEKEVEKGDIRLSIPFADYLPVFRDIKPDVEDEDPSFADPQDHIPPAVLKALRHVREHMPGVSRVVFWGDHRWVYITEDNEVPQFPDGIDCDILETAAESVAHRPVVYELKIPN